MINTQIAENVYYNSKNSQKSNANFVMGYALNLCKSYIYNVPYNHNISEEGVEMTQNRVRIVDVADALGLSTATVSKVIHGKTEKISDETVKRVQQELERSGYIPNMDGLILIGFCEADSESLRNQMRISFVVYDGYFEKCSKVVNLVIDHYNGGYQAGKYLKKLGHKKALCIADNFICMDKERIEGFRKAFEQGETYRWEIPKTEKERTFGFQRISRSSALMIIWQAGKAILPLQRFIRKQT